jgi:beta-N-acetylhexosaminidase
VKESLERLASACILPGAAGLTAPDWLRRELAGGLGGVVVFSRNVRDRDQLAALTGSIRAEREVALIGIDEEGGDVTRLEAATGSSYPGSLALGEVDDIELTEEIAASIASELVAAGVNLDLAPVADVNTSPLNPVIGVRAFGSDPELVARHVAASVTGLQSRGVIACAKHFPGHGAAEADSHLELPTIASTREELRRVELVPFRAAIAAGVRAIMTAHILVPAIDALPATVSRVHLHELLRVELGFRGLVVTDALEMRGISATVGVEEAAVLAIAAGADALCLGHDLEREAVDSVRRALVGAVEAGRLSEERLAEAATRVEDAGAWSRTPRPRVRPEPGIGLAAAQRALAIDGDVRAEGAVFVVELAPERMMAADPARHSLGELVRERSPGSGSIKIEAGRRDPSTIRAEAAGRQLVLVVRDPQRNAWERTVVDSLLRQGADAIVVDIGYPAWRPENTRGTLATFGASRVSLLAAAEAIVPSSG